MAVAESGGGRPGAAPRGRDPVDARNGNREDGGADGRIRTRREAGREERRVLGVAEDAAVPLPIDLVVQMRDDAKSQQRERREGSPRKHPAPVRPHGADSWLFGRQRQVGPGSGRSDLSL